MHVKLLFLTIVFLLLTPTSLEAKGGDIFTALASMKRLIRYEQYLLDLLDRYVESHPDPHEDLKMFVREIQESTLNVMDDIEVFLGHPVNSFLLLRRFTKHWQQIDRFLEDKRTKDDGLSLQGPEGLEHEQNSEKNSPPTPAQELKKTLQKNRKTFPEPEDLLGSVEAIIRLQEVYNISASIFANGQLSNKTFAPTLGVDECFEVGYVANEREKWIQAYEWMAEAFRKMNPPFEYNYRYLTRVDVLEYLSWAEYKTDRLKEAIEHTKEIIEIEPKNKNAKKNLLYYKMELQQLETKGKRDPGYLDVKPPKKKEDYMEIYEKLCQGKESRDQEELDVLFCYYQKNDPTILLKPLEVEIISSNPDVYIFHNFITDSEIEYLKDLAKPLLQRATVNNIITGELEYADYRISKSGWLRDEEGDEVLQRLNRRMEAMSGLSCKPEHSEALQVQNYGTGGHYEPHTDHADNEKAAIMKLGMGNRIATVLLYFTDVEQGGYTIFVDAGVVVRPKKGDAAFWFNLKRSGAGDPLTRHAGCPVIVGTKWVANKWIHQHGQEFRRRCSWEEFE